MKAVKDELKYRLRDLYKNIIKRYQSIKIKFKNIKDIEFLKKLPMILKSKPIINHLLAEQYFKSASCMAFFLFILFSFSIWTNYGLALNDFPVTQVRAAEPNINEKDENTAELTLHRQGIKIEAQKEQNLKTDTKKKVSAPKSQKSSKEAKNLKTTKPTEANYKGDPFSYPQCVWYAWARAKETTGISLRFKSDYNRSAKYWLNMVAEIGSVSVVKDPQAVRANSIAVFLRGGNGNGHVAYVENVKTGKNGKPKSVVISESNWGSSKRPSQKSMSWDEFINRSNGSLAGYIYL